MRQLSKRLKPGTDLKEELVKFTQKNQVKAGVLLSIVGSLKETSLRVADGKTVKKWSKPLEIVSGTGTLSINGCHIHISASDEDGMTVGGHLKEGCVINTTTEVVILVFDDVEYQRLPDDSTGYDELTVK